jgi:3-hydroxy-3-methylglutaryl CoA synthase
MTTYSPVFFRDMAERAISTYVQTFLGLLIASTTLDLKVIQSAAVAAIPAALSVVKSILAEKYVPGTVSPASLAGR